MLNILIIFLLSKIIQSHENKGIIKIKLNEDSKKIISTKNGYIKYLSYTYYDRGFSGIMMDSEYII